MDVPLGTVALSKSRPNHHFARITYILSWEGNWRPVALTLSVSEASGGRLRKKKQVGVTHVWLTKKKGSGFKILR